MKMDAAVVKDFASAPEFGIFDQPLDPPDGEVRVRVRAAALSNLVKAQASGKHCSSRTVLPFIPGNDGVGTLSDGKRVYFLFPRAPFGSMAEETVVAKSNILSVPDTLSDETAAAMANPGMGSWGALLGRAHFVNGESVLINGATGVAGQQAVQAAKALGARRIVVAGRNSEALASLRDLGATDFVTVTPSIEETKDNFRASLNENRPDVVLDYLWGASALAILEAFAGNGSETGEPPSRFVQIGSVSSEVIELPAHILRSSGWQLVGSGIGSLSRAEIMRALQAQYQWAASEGVKINVETKPLTSVADAWSSMESGKRIVLIP